MRAPLHLRPWAAGDEAAFEARPDMAAEHAALAWDWSAGPPGPTWTIVRFPGRVLGVGGGWPDPVRRDHFQAWCCLTELGFVEWGAAIDCAAVVLKRLEEKHGARRITALVREGFAAGERVLERLGFTRSAEAPEWPGYRIMARGK